MSLKERIINNIIRVEGGYVNDPSDSGGETNFGITIAVARSYGYTGLMSDMPREVAFDIYSAKYWDAVKADNILLMSEHIAEEVVDTSVNMGPNRAAKFLQRALNTLNNRGALYPDIIVDGLIGWGTLDALDKYLTVRDVDVLVKMLNCLQGSFYVVLSERREKDEKYIYGWFKNRVV
ncbi:MAG: hypothetical protein K0U20_08965 [Proteobacteria bacterium]|nr:hypothetical protein [Pseudomonadota bacterium]